ncbi:MAG: class I SAM-dependent rRNA methyltransferase [Candidatus Poribacteria bacterium]
MKVILKPKKEKPIIQNHPWIFSGAIGKIEGNPQDGDIVDVFDSSGNFLAKGYINQKSQITVRILTKDKEEINESFFKRRIAQAIKYRQEILNLKGYDAYRLIHDSADMLPGFIVDKYADFIVVQILTFGIEKRRDVFINIINELLNPKGVYERSDSPVRKKEGLTPISGLIFGQEPPDLLNIRQKNVNILVDIKSGQKTGTFLDQRENLEIISAFSGGRDVLDCFCHTGSFSIYSAYGGAKSVLGVDISGKAIEMARTNTELNRVADISQFQQEDIFRFLDNCDRKFDLIILDPPGFAKNDSAVAKASRAYKHINMKAMRMLNPDGILATFSCSHHIDPPLFRKIVFSASVDAGCNIQIMRTLHASPDHPINIAYPEGEYLKGLLCHKIS